MDPDAANAQSEPKTCQHDTMLSYCGDHDIIVCAECYFSFHRVCSEATMLKQASHDCLQQLFAVQGKCEESKKQCHDMQDRVSK